MLSRLCTAIRCVHMQHGTATPSRRKIRSLVRCPGWRCSTCSEYANAGIECILHLCWSHADKVSTHSTSAPALCRHRYHIVVSCICASCIKLPDRDALCTRSSKRHQRHQGGTNTVVSPCVSTVDHRNSRCGFNAVKATRTSR